MMPSNITGAPKSSGQRTSSTTTPAPPTPPMSSCSTSIIPSSNPLSDAQTLLNLLPGRFTLDSTSTADGGVVNLPSKSSSEAGRRRRSQRSKEATQQSQQPESSSTSPPFAILASEREILMFVNNYNDENHENASPTKNTMPNATLVLEELLIDSVISSLNVADNNSDSGKKCQLIMCQTSPSLMASVKLAGGGVVLLVSGEALSTVEKRIFLAQLVATGGGDSNIPTKNSGTTTRRTIDSFRSSSGELMDVDLNVLGDEENNNGEISSTTSSSQIQPPTKPPPMSAFQKNKSIGEAEQADNIPISSSSSNIPPPPPFPSLSVGVMNGDNEVQPGFQINSRDGVPVNTDLFEGRAIMLIRPQNAEDDLYYHDKLFSKKKRRFAVQLQGKLKYKPKGILYSGMEVTEQMKLGLVSKGLCSILLKLVSKISGGMHHSFGDSKGEEWPHIVFPAWTFFDKIVITKPGETPPPMGDEFPETNEVANARKASGKTGPAGDWNTEDTYSLSFHSMYLDLPTWHLVKLKVMKDVDLRQFWGDSMVRIVVYEKAAKTSEAKHSRKNNKYIVGLQAQYLGITDEEGTNVKVENVDSLPWDKTRPSITRSVQSYSDLAMAIKDDDDDVRPETQQKEEKLDVIEDNFDDGNDEDDSSEASATQFFDARESTQRSGSIELGLETIGLGDEVSVLTTPPALVVDQKANIYESTLKPDLLCPAWIEMCESKGKYSKVYAFTVENNSKTIFRTSDYFADLFATDNARALLEAKCSLRASSSEKLRRYMGSVLTQPTKNIRKFSELKSKHDGRFLQRQKPSLAKAKTKPLASDFVGRALSERHWIEELAVVTSRYISFYHPESKKPRFRICLRGFVGVRKLSEENKPNFPMHHFLEIESLGRTVYLMFLKECQRDSWITVLSKVPSVLEDGRLAGQELRNSPPSTGSRSSLSKGSEMDSLLAFDDPSDEFLHKSTVWSCKQRRILNCRNLVFTSLGQAGVQYKKYKPNELAEDALKKALEPMGNSEEGNLRDFLDSASALKEVNVSDMNESERLAFFLNLYHIMVMHAFLVLGIPDSSFKWASYFNMISYQCSDDIFSLTELEHCIIRANMSSPSLFVAQFVLPKSFYDFALKRSDYRINFALNCGSLSNPRIVPVYRPEIIDEQLDDATKWYLRESVQVKKNGRDGSALVTLPRICQWYAADFGRGRPIDIVCLVKKCLDKNVQELLPDNLSETDKCYTKKVQNAFKESAITVKYAQYSYKCRHLTLLQDLS